MTERQKVLDYVLWSDKWKAAKLSSEWADFPYFGEGKSGHIGLQIIGGGVSNVQEYKNKGTIKWKRA